MRTSKVVDAAARVSVLSILFVLGGAMIMGVLASEAYDWWKKDAPR